MSSGGGRFAGPIRRGAAALVVFVLAGALFTAASAAPRPASDELYRAELSGENLTPLVNTPATATLELAVASDEQSIDYQFRAKNLRNVRSIRIFAGSQYYDWYPLATIFESFPATKRVANLRGTLRPPDLGPYPYLWDDLLWNLRNGYATVRVDTTIRPDGEIRGFLERVEVMSRPMTGPKGKGNGR